MPAARNQTSTAPETATAGAPQDPWMTPNQASAAAKKSRLQLYELALQGRIKTTTAGGRRFFDRADVEALTPPPGAPARARRVAAR